MKAVLFALLACAVLTAAACADMSTNVELVSGAYRHPELFAYRP
jgi:hypothetical protein